MQVLRGKHCRRVEAMRMKTIAFASVALVAIAIVILLSGSMFTGSVVNLKETEREERERPVTAREPAVAGTFYPSDANELGLMIDAYIMTSGAVYMPKIRGLVSPHAGYIYSGPTAAYGFSRLNDNDYDTILIMGPSHNFRFEGASLPNVTHYRTPLGLVRLSDKANLIRQEILFSNSDNRIHEPEHSGEVQLPFLQERLKGSDFKIIPVVTGIIGPETLADVLLKYVDDRTLVIASSDLSHYHTYEEAVRLDSSCTESVPNLDIQKTVDECEACGKIPVLTLMYMAVKKGWEGRLLDYSNSGDTAGDRQAVVGYMSVAFFEHETKKQHDELSEYEEKFLLELARNTIDSYLSNLTVPEVEESQLTPVMKKTTGCFVTLMKNGQLRGCIGHILPQAPLYQCVIQNAISAALFDSRFTPVTLKESKGCKIDISVLTVPHKLVFSSYEELLNGLRPNTDGVVLRYQGRTSTYLPSVWSQLPDKQQFLSRLCMKQGSPSNCWKQPDVVVETYQSFEFHE